VNPPVAMTIAGSDSGGGAGIPADLKTFAALGVFGTSAITALTAQNTAGVAGVHPIPPEFVTKQITTVLDDLPVAAVKTGMLATAPILEAVASLAAAGRLPNLVVDPVMVSSTGDRLLDLNAERAYMELLLPQALAVTPNLREAEVLLGRRITTLAEQRTAAEELAALGPRVVVVKGGHAVSDTPDDAVDIVLTDGQVTELRAPRVATGNNHGSGCSFSSAIAANLARGLSVLDAVGAAKEFVHRGIVGGATWALGKGHGPLDHFGWASTT
jgi:hydroxymethylpyrimidine/phosphomethylpyrimidine kinase